MKIFILAGGLGTRIPEYTKSIPKPMIRIGKYPIIIHIIKLYMKFGHKDFFILTGYRSEVIKNYFKNFKSFDKEFIHRIENKTIKVTLLNTGKKTMTGGRLKQVKKFLKKDETFMFTYGDALANIDLKKLLNFHKLNQSLVTVTAVRPPQDLVKL